MSGVLLTAYSGAILGPIAKFLGWIMNGIYNLMYQVFGIEDVALSILIITILIYMCLLPLTIKQQKFAKLQQKMQPEIQEIQNKYKNKKDQASMQAMQQETQLVYQKYGVSPAGSCVQLLIQMPLLFALYRVFYNVPAYISSVKHSFDGVVNVVTNTSGYEKIMADIISDYNLKNVSVDFSTTDTSALKNYVVDVLYKLPRDGWENLTDYFSNIGPEVDKLTPHLDQFNYAFGLNISDTPLNIITTCFHNGVWGMLIVALLVPVISCLTQFLNIKLMPQAANNNDQMAQQMKMMNMMMPLMSLFIAFTCPVGLGLYWICSAVVRAVQQIFVNNHIKNLNLDDIIQKNQEKAKKKREKMGISENQIRNAASMKTKSMAGHEVSSAQRELELEKAAAKKANAKAGSMAAKANMVREFNEKNSQK